MEGECVIGAESRCSCMVDRMQAVIQRCTSTGWIRLEAGSGLNVDGTIVFTAEVCPGKCRVHGNPVYEIFH